jgi:Family of unknown function (DUF6790)
MVNRAAEYWPYGFCGVAIVAAILNIALFGGRVVESFLLWFLVIVVGFGSLYAFVGHAFVADDVARSIGWPTGSPFQFEVALHNLAIGVWGCSAFGCAVISGAPPSSHLPCLGSRRRTATFAICGFTKTTRLAMPDRFYT